MNKIIVFGTYKVAQEGTNYHSYNEFEVFNIYDFDFMELMIHKATFLPRSLINAYRIIEYGDTIRHNGIIYTIRLV